MSIKQLTFLDIATVADPGSMLQVEHIPEPIGDMKTATKLRKLADRLQGQIDNKSRPMTQNPTPKRNRDYSMRYHDAANLERGQKALYALAELHEQGAVPPCLVGLKTKKAIMPLVATKGRSEGYYHYSDSGEYSYDTPEAKALQALIDGSSEEQAQRKLERDIAQLEANARLLVGQVPGFFPTPRPVVETMLQHIHIESGMSVLEPSAGSGAIADVIRERYPKANIALIERNYTLRALLKMKGYYVIDKSDFLNYYVTQNGVDGWHVIVMNPPFEKMQDVDHVRHAYDCLKTGGTLVSVMSISPFFRENKKAVAFREWLDDVGGYQHELSADAFKKSGAGAKSCLVIIHK